MIALEPQASRASRVPRRARRLALVALALAFFAGPGLLSAQDLSSPGPSDPPSREFTRSDIALSVAMGAAFNVGSAIESFWSGAAWHAPVFIATVSAQNLPALFYVPRSAGMNLGIQAGLDASFAIGRYVFPGDATANSVLFNAAHKFSMFASYDSYSRMRLAEVGGPGDFRRYGLGQLAFAPFNPEVLKDWRVWGEIGTKAAIAAIRIALANKDDSVWERGTSWIGSHQLEPAIGVPLMLLIQTLNFTMTAVGEESLYRGTYYEEMKRGMGVWPARIADASYFTLIHYPQKWDSIKARPIWETLLNFSLSAANIVWWQYVYDEEGLPATVAIHAWSDVIGFGAAWLLTAGAGNENSEGLRI
jgi:membrane protease YdiL (CAAX protease family)